MKLYEKAQNNISKPAAAETGLLKKIRKIFYLLPKAVCFKNEWGNRDINVAEQTFQSLISQPMQGPLSNFLKLFFDDALVEMVVDYTKLNGHREKADTSFLNY